MRFRVVIDQDEDGKYVSHCPSLPGCWSQGDTRQQAIDDIKDAVASFLESLPKYGDPIPPPMTEEVIEIEP